MHALHCILVYLDEPEVERLLNQHDEETEAKIKREIRAIAMEATGDYEGEAFDWRSEDDAGSWIEDFPGEGVVLGAKEPERFKKLLADYSHRPLKRAFKLIEDLNYYELAYRTEKEIKNSSGLVIVDRSQVKTDSTGEKRYWSGWKAPQIVVNKDLAQKIWTRKAPWADPWTLAKIFELLNGNYHFESQFYSVPDASAKISEGVFKDAMERPEDYALVFSDYHY